MRLAGLKHHHNHEVDEAGDQMPMPDIDNMMKNLQGKVQRTNTSSGMVNGKPTTYDDAMKQMPKISFGGQDFDMNNPDDMGEKIKGMMGGMMQGVQANMPNQNVQIPGGNINPAEMMKNILSKIQGR
jgi:hypothetical protein